MILSVKERVNIVEMTLDEEVQLLAQFSLFLGPDSSLFGNPRFQLPGVLFAIDRGFQIHWLRLVLNVHWVSVIFEGPALGISFRGQPLGVVNFQG